VSFPHFRTFKDSPLESNYKFFCFTIRPSSKLFPCTTSPLSPPNPPPMSTCPDGLFLTTSLEEVKKAFLCPHDIAYVRLPSYFPPLLGLFLTGLGVGASSHH